VVDEPERASLRFRLDGDEVTRHEAVKRDLPAQILTVRMRYERSRDGAVVANDEVEFRMRWFFRFELEHLLARAGFEVVSLFGDFDRSPYRAGSPAMIWIAR
jgi:hypothetical protein